MAYITTEQVKQIRQALKTRFPDYRFSVRKGSNGLSVAVTILRGPGNLSDIASHYMVNEYHLGNYGEHTPFFIEVVDAIKNGSDRKWYDNSDAQYDHFDTAFYINLKVGSWKKPYQQI